MTQTPDNHVREPVIAAISCDLQQAPLGTESRLERRLGGVPVLRRTVERVAAVERVDRVVLMTPEGQEERVRQLVEGIEKAVTAPLVRRGAGLEQRVRAGRAWGTMAWRGGAGQWTVFDEDYHPQSVWKAVEQHAGGAAGHVLIVPAHAGLADSRLLAALLQHHLHKNHELPYTYAPAAPGLCGMVLRGQTAGEMAEAGVLPGQLLAYSPTAPTFDTLIREACMQVDPALSKVPNRFLLDTERSWQTAEALEGRAFESLAELALAARGLRGEQMRQPLEIELELTGRRLTQPMGGAPEGPRLGRGMLEAGQWTNWWKQQRLLDDVTVTVGGDGDPLLYEGLVEVLKAARAAGARSLHVQTDLLEGTERLTAAIEAGVVDVISVQFYGDSAETYRHVGGLDGYGRLLGNLEALARRLSGRGVPLVIPRLLKVRQTIPEMENFFDQWILRSGWAVIDGPTDRAGSVPMTAVADMAPPKRRACRRIAASEGRLLLRANGTAVACDQDIHDRLALGHIAAARLDELWSGEAMARLRRLHGEGKWSDLAPCATCREWHRA